MKRIPAGEYKVGSSAQERQELARKYNLHPSMLGDELEAATVKLNEFYIDEYPVTNAQYAAFIKATGADEPYDWPIHGTAERANHPVCGVGGEAARLYAEWAGKRLPTPQEWEAAFRGVKPQGDRVFTGSHWMPETYPVDADPGPVSDFGAHGLWQVSEWTSTAIVRNGTPFRMLKGASWICQDGWSLRVNSSYHAFAPWCRQWTGFRCASDKDVPTVPTAPLPVTAAPNYHVNPPANTSGVKFLGHRGAVSLPNITEGLGIACPEGVIIDGRGLGAGEYEELTRPTAAEFATGTFSTRVRVRQLEMEIRNRAGADFFDMDYALTNPTDTDATAQPSSCMNPGIIDEFYDFEGRRTFLWFGKGDWVPVRALERGTPALRWIVYVNLPTPAPKDIIVAVLGHRTGRVFAYGRPGMTGPMAFANNWCFSCLHMDPVVPVPARGEALARARCYCLKGGLDEVRQRFIDDFCLTGK